MRKLSIVIGLAVLAMGGAVYAQGAGGDAKKAPEAAKPAAAAPAPEMPMKPAPELAQQLGGMVGNWKCEGKGTMGGHEMKSKGTFKVAWATDLGKYWLVAHSEGKSEGMPGSYKGTDMYGYDPGTKMFVDVGVDNMGGYAMAKSKGWEGDKLVWNGHGSMMGKESDFTVTVSKKGDKEVGISFQMGADTGESTCKK